MKVKISTEIEDEITIGFVKIIEELQKLAQEIISNIAQQTEKINFKPIVVVAIIIMKRCIECVDSIKILSLIGNERDVAVLILNLVELRLDILYIAKDHNKANEWVEHDKEYKKPWSVSFLYKELYNGSELEAERNIYKRFSMIKHGNPVGGLTSFPIGISDRYLVVKNKAMEENLLPVYLFACGSEIHRMSEALIHISQEYGFDLITSKERLGKLKYKLDKLNDNYIKSKIYKLKTVTLLPGLCENCGAIPKGVIEITCLLKQSNRKDNENFKCDKYKPL